MMTAILIQYLLAGLFGVAVLFLVPKSDVE